MNTKSKGLVMLMSAAFLMSACGGNSPGSPLSREDA